MKKSSWTQCGKIFTGLRTSVSIANTAANYATGKKKQVDTVQDVHTCQYYMALEQVGTYNKEDVRKSYDSVGPKHMKRYRLYSDHCRYKMNCLFGKRCQNQHSEEEKAYFRQRPNGRGKPLRKTKL